MVASVQSSLGSRRSRLRRRATRLDVARTRLVLMGSIRWLVLGICRLWGRHAIIVYWTHISPRAVRPVRHQRVWARWRPIHSVSWRWARGSRCC